jgi:superfamily I DNA/RNA helicase
VPFFTTSRDAAKYERLKTGLALYRLVFGQSNQEDLLDTLQRQNATLEPASREAHLKRLSSYMLNLSPINHATALRHAAEEANELLKDATGVAVLRLVADVRQLLRDRAAELSRIASEVEGLLEIIEKSSRSGRQNPTALRVALEALSYLRNPYDHIFDLHVEGGFMDDIDVVQRAWAKLRA